MKLTWPNGTKEYLLLNQIENLPEVENTCLFEGESHIMNSGTVVAVVGCMESYETIINLGSASGVLELILLKNGTALEQIVGSTHLREKRGKKYFILYSLE